MSAARDHGRRPAPRSIDDAESVPKSLRERDQWVLWRNEGGVKVPYTIAGKRASTTDSGTWSAYEEVVEAFNTSLGEYSGPGFVFTEADPLVGIDFDDCVDSTGRITPKVTELLPRLHDCYVERSPSGTGLKAFGFGNHARAITATPLGDGSSFEVYSSGRYFTITGDILPGWSSDINWIQGVIDDLVRRAEAQSRRKGTAVLGDIQEVVKIAPYVERVIESEIQTIESAEPGSQNPTLNRASWNVGRYCEYLARPKVEKQLIDAGMRMRNQPGRKPWTQREISNVVQAGMNSGALQPRILVERKLAAVPGVSTGCHAAEEDASSEGEPPTPQFDPKTHRLLSPVPTIGDTILYHEKFAKNAGENLFSFKDGVYRDDGFYVIRQRSKKLMQGWGVAGQWKKGVADEVREWVSLASPELLERPPIDRINLQNGILNVNTGKLDPHSPGFLTNIQLPVRYDPSADSTEWDRFFQTTLPEDAAVAEVGYQIAALCMVPFTGPQRALLLRGPRGTGKSRYLEMIRAFLGAGNTSSMSLHMLEENRFASVYLFGKLANICPDLPNQDLENTSKFKAITGEDFITAEYKHGEQFQFRPFSRLLFSANQAPQSRDASDAFLDRWWVIPFDRRFQDSADQISASELDRKLCEPRQLSGVLNKALKWLPTVIANHGIAQTKSMREAHDEFCEASDPFRVWLAQFIEDDSEGLAPTNEVMLSYFSFRRERGLAAITPKAFGLELRKHKRGLTTAERTVERGGVRMSKTLCYVGLRLKSKA